MLEIIKDINSVVNNIVWGVPAMVCILGVGLLLSIRTGFLQFGKQYVFGWKGAVPVRYEDIQRIYVCSHVASAISINELLPRNPVYVTTEKGEQYMGTIPDDSLDYYVTFLREKNPLIQYCIMKPGRFGRNNRYIPYDEYWKNVQEKAERKHRSIEHWKSVLKKASRKQ